MQTVACGPWVAHICEVPDKLTNGRGLLLLGNHVFEGAGSHVVAVAIRRSGLGARHEAMAAVEGKLLLQGPLASRADRNVEVRVRNRKRNVLPGLGC